MSNNVSLRVIKETNAEFDSILGIDGKPVSPSRDSLSRLDQFEETFRDLDEVGSQKNKQPLQFSNQAFRHPTNRTAESFPQHFDLFQIPHPKDPSVIWTARDLFTLCGPLITILIIGQIFSSLNLTHLVLRLIRFDHYVLDSIFLLSMSLIDGIIFAFWRGKKYSEWYRPIAIASIITVLPGLFAFFHSRLGFD